MTSSGGPLLADIPTFNVRFRFYSGPLEGDEKKETRYQTERDDVAAVKRRANLALLLSAIAGVVTLFK